MRRAFAAGACACLALAIASVTLSRILAADGPNLVAEKTNDAPARGVAPGQSFTWRIAVRNVGNQNAQTTATSSTPRTLLRDQLPDGAGYTALQTQYEGGATATGLTCGISNRILTCSLVGGTVTIPAGGAVVVSFRVTVNSTFSGSELVNPSSPNQCVVDERPNVAGGWIAETDEGDNTCRDTVRIDRGEPAPSPTPSPTPTAT
ncbi:MAG: hypothetical protein NZ761_05785, partial [Dehalococcoidia bacterium]|nr:hypothetical protein [Dehalococcoidia bacterium]